MEQIKLEVTCVEDGNRVFRMSRIIRDSFDAERACEDFNRKIRSVSAWNRDPEDIKLNAPGPQSFRYCRATISIEQPGNKLRRKCRIDLVHVDDCVDACEGLKHELEHLIFGELNTNGEKQESMQGYEEYLRLAGQAVLAEQQTHHVINDDNISAKIAKIQEQTAKLQQLIEHEKRVQLSGKPAGIGSASVFVGECGSIVGNYTAHRAESVGTHVDKAIRYLREGELYRAFAHLAEVKYIHIAPEVFDEYDHFAYELAGHNAGARWVKTAPWDEIAIVGSNPVQTPEEAGCYGTSHQEADRILLTQFAQMLDEPAMDAFPDTHYGWLVGFSEAVVDYWGDIMDSTLFQRRAA